MGLCRCLSACLGLARAPALAMRASSPSPIRPELHRMTLHGWYPLFHGALFSLEFIRPCGHLIVGFGRKPRNGPA